MPRHRHHVMPHGNSGPPAWMPGHPAPGSEAMKSLTVNHKEKGSNSRCRRNNFSAGLRLARLFVCAKKEYAQRGTLPPGRYEVRRFGATTPAPCVLLALFNLGLSPVQPIDSVVHLRLRVLTKYECTYTNCSIFPNPTLKFDGCPDLLTDGIHR